MSFLLESLLWAFTQAKGTCEDYNPVLPEGSMGSFNNSSPGPTPSAAVLEDQPVTRGTFSGGTMFRRKLNPYRWTGVSIEGHVLIGVRILNSGGTVTSQKISWY